MAYRRTKIGKNSYSTMNTNGVSTFSYSVGNKNYRVTQTTKSNGKSYTTTTMNNGGWITREIRSNSPRSSRSRRQAHMSFKYTPQLFLLSVVLIALGFVLDKLGF